MRRGLRALKRVTGLPIATALGGLLRLSSRRAGLALMYHGIESTSGDPWEILPAHGRTLFEAQLRHLRRRYAVVPAHALLVAVAGRRRGERFPVTITFDDDLPSHAGTAMPVLRREGLTAIFLVSGASLSEPFSFWWERLQRAVDAGVADSSLVPVGVGMETDLALTPGSPDVRSLAGALERLPALERDRLAEDLAARLGPDPPDAGMRTADVRALSEAGFEIGFHTRRHHRLPLLDDSELGHAMVEGRAEVAAAAGVALRGIGYPHGKADERVASAARAAGFTLGFSVGRAAVHPGTDALLIPRIQPTHVSLGHFAVELVAALVRHRTGAPLRRTARPRHDA
jgi:peptidoglycan/xylan/chitin deacetylase (PgdA/CDA1 family)